MKYLSIAGLLIIAFLLGINQRANQRIDQYQAGATAGSVAAESKAIFAQREAERVREVEAAAQAWRDQHQREHAAQAAHDAVWNEIMRLRTFDSQQNTNSDSAAMGRRR